jgi:hypothetical protein
MNNDSLKWLIGCTTDIHPLKLSLLLRGGTRIDWVELKPGYYYDGIINQGV